MIVYKIPHKARFLALTLNFKAAFSETEPGKYVFNDTALLFEAVPNTVFLIERLSVSGDISEASFLSSIQETPLVRFRKKTSGEILHNEGIPVNKFYNGLDTGIWFKNDTEGEGVNVQFTGKLKQISETVGKTELNISVSCLVWAVDEREYNRAFRSDIHAGVLYGGE